MSHPPLGLHVATHTVSPLHLLHVPSPPAQKARGDPPKSELCPKNEMLNPWHPPREQSWVSGGPRTCENVRNPNVWTGFLCLPQTSQHRRHPNGDVSRAAVSSLPQLHQPVPPGDILGTPSWLGNLLPVLFLGALAHPAAQRWARGSQRVNGIRPPRVVIFTGLRD